jgi:dTDP-4-amino-4,6-dideoxygalactose transaminase
MSNLAALGGEPVAPNGLSGVWPVTGDEERKAMLSTLERGQWCRAGLPDEVSEGAHFENEWAAYHDAKYCVAVANGTVALIVAFRALGVNCGDEVIVPSVTFTATADAVALCGAVPVFVDIDPETYQIDPDLIEAAVSERTKAICVVHYAGYPADLDRIAAVSKRTGLPVVEDCAHAQGTEWKGRKVGAGITAGTFSFQQSKSLTAGEGGAVIMDSAELADAVWAVHNCGRVKGVSGYDHAYLGGNFRLSEWEATMLRVQLKRLPDQTKQRMETAAAMSKHLPPIGGLTPLKPDARITQRGYYFYIIRYDANAWGGVPRNAFLKALAHEGVAMGSAYGNPVYKNRHYLDGLAKHRIMPCPHAERATAEEQVSLSSRYLLDRSNAKLVVDACAKIRENVDELREFAATL